MKFIAHVEVVGVRAEKDTKIIHDGGILSIRRNQFLFMGTNYGPVVAWDWEDLDLELASRDDGPEEAKLRRVLKEAML